VRNVVTTKENEASLNFGSIEVAALVAFEGAWGSSVMRGRFGRRWRRQAVEVSRGWRSWPGRGEKGERREFKTGATPTPPLAQFTEYRWGHSVL